MAQIANIAFVLIELLCELFNANIGNDSDFRVDRFFNSYT